MVDWDQHIMEEVSVAKKDPTRQRMVVDARLANGWFGGADYTP